MGGLRILTLSNCPGACSIGCKVKYIWCPSYTRVGTTCTQTHQASFLTNVFLNMICTLIELGCQTTYCNMRKGKSSGEHTSAYAVQLKDKNIFCFALWILEWIQIFSASLIEGHMRYTRKSMICTTYGSG